MFQLSRRIINFWVNYNRLGLKITLFLISLQLLHLYWLTSDVVLYRITGESYFFETNNFFIIFIIIDYIEIPALISGIIFYSFNIFYNKENGKNNKDFIYLIFLSLQIVHIFWITDEIVYGIFVGSSFLQIPEFIAWIAILIDYLELPVMIDLFRKIIKN